MYLDHNATVPVRAEAIEAVNMVLLQCGNPSSVHAPGRRARACLEQARSQIARAINAHREDLVFTSGGAEANNLAIKAGLAAGARRIVVSAIEHDAVMAPARTSSAEVEIWPVTTGGLVDLGWLDVRLTQATESGEPPILFALMAANNETGVIQPYVEAGRKVREAGHFFHVDAVQMLGKAGFNFAGSGAHFAALSSHKVGGPQGVGALATACDAGVSPLIVGGGQEKGRRGGTENLAGIAGFAAALGATLADDSASVRVRTLRDQLQTRLQAAPGVRIWGDKAPRLDNTLCLTALGWPSEIQVIALDLAGFAVSAGSACSSGKVLRSNVLGAMGASDSEAASALRISLGWTTTRDDIEAFADAWIAEYNRVRLRMAI